MDGGGPDDSGSNMVLTIRDLLSAKLENANAGVVSRMTRTFSRSMVVTLVAMIACIVVAYALGVRLLFEAGRDMERVIMSGDARKVTQDVIQQVRLLEMSAAGIQPRALRDTVRMQQAINTASASTLTTIGTLLTSVSSDALAESNLLHRTKGMAAPFEQPVTVPVLVWDPFNATKVRIAPTLMDLYNQYCAAGRAVGAMPNTSFPVGSSASLLSQPDFRFILDNGYTSLYPATWNLVDVFSKAYATSMREKLVILSALAAAVSVVPCLLTVCIFWPAFGAVRRDRCVVAMLHPPAACAVDGCVGRPRGP
jgi:hypothetical protein